MQTKELKASEKLDLIDKIGRELQQKYTFSDIDIYLKDFNVQPPIEPSYNSKWVYSKQALADVQSAVLLEIAADLKIVDVFPSENMKPPKIWVKCKKFRLFVSHISKDKDKAMRLKETLASHKISAFVAHEDIEPTLIWQDEIERGLYAMDAMVTVHTPGFSLSHWTQQEIGFALGRNVKIISLRMGEDPSGFLSKQQALSRRNRKAEKISEEIVKLLKEDSRTAEKLKDI